MLFITVKSAENVYVSKVLQVVEEAKRIRHKAGKYGVPSMICFREKDSQDYLKKKSYINTSFTTLDRRKRVLVELNWTMMISISRHTCRPTA